MDETVTSDNRWLFVRVEEAGTPWAAYELDAEGALTGRWTYRPSERAARTAAESGVLLAELDAQAAAAARPRCAWRGQFTASVCSRPAGPDGRCNTPAHARETS
jgi:hypothetical protein